MPPGFSAEEKSRIADLLMESGRELFTTLGLRKTSLEELVAPAGIAKSSFYQFFDSKEALYLELMLAQMARVKKHVIDEALLEAPDIREGLRGFLRATLDTLATDPLYRRLMTHPEEMAAVARKLDPARITDAPDNPARALAEFITAKRASGDLIAADPEVITGVLRAVLLVPMHADRLASPDRYSEIIDLLVDIVSAGLTAHQG
ncbi:AcrR family transcriptional regulator [Lipingzhangella halophila]|uniref:AcrR family transcriptional regulator n=1 Tax=Lipingzhangella halophila TaxID=1783352 RepID=A0A7W7W2V0_9ACTN|nr:TetR/AcrR family transcriptional regulator [Lipingzhangella halophila]MBB4931154.1 AcrR family transcriptional regulator [Lipingzhangella halophila]